MNVAENERSMAVRPSKRTFYMSLMSFFRTFREKPELSFRTPGTQSVEPLHARKNSAIFALELENERY